MKKTLLTFLLLIATCFSYAQVSWQGGNDPTASQSATLLFDATGTTLENYQGTIYAHTGATVTSSHWMNVIGNWGENNVQPALTLLNGNIYSLQLTPTIADFYDNPTGLITAIDIVLRSADGNTKTGDNNLSLAFNTLTRNTPTENIVIAEANSQINISASTTSASNFSLKANGIEINTDSGVTDYSYDFTITEDTNFVLEANDGNTVLTETFKARLTPLFPVPNGMLDGINLNTTDNTKATLVLFAPGKQTVHVIGDFNNWQENSNYLMNYDSAREKYWIELNRLTPKFNHMFQYLVDSSIRVADPYSTIILDETNDQYINATTYPDLPSYPTGSTNHAVTLLRTGDTPYTWEVTNFQRPEKTDLVIYELLIRDFDALHTYDAVKNRLDYLESLGINAIELMPVNEFDGNLSWGYNPSFHMALDKYYGNATTFKQLIDECHKRGIAIILDVVFNHTSGQNPFYRLWNTTNGGYNGKPSADNPFFNETTTHAYAFFNDLNHQSEATKNYIERITKYWINEFKIDGFRWDLTKGFTQNCTPSDQDCTNGTQQDRVDVLKEYADYQWDADPNFYIIFEHLGGIQEEKQWADYRADEGKGIMLWNRLDPPYSEATIGKHTSGASDFSNVSYINKGFDKPSAVSYMESHDEQRVMYRNLQEGKNNGDYSAKNLNTALSRMKTAGAFFFTVPGPKMIWQFGELGYEIGIDVNGRTGEKPIRWEYLDNPNRKAIYDTWSKLIDLKLSEPIFKTNNFTIDANKTTGLKSIHLTDANAIGDAIKNVSIIGNFGLVDQNIDPKFQHVGTWYNLLNKNLPFEVSTVNGTITLKPGEFIIYGDKPFIAPNDLDSDGVTNNNDTCNNTPLGTTVDVNGCEVFSLPSNNFSIQTLSETCRNSNNGSINISATENFNYNISVTGNNVDLENSFTSTYNTDSLEAGDYSVCITIEGQVNYEQCYHVTITQPEDLSVLSKTDNKKGVVSLDLSGSSIYYVTINGSTVQTSLSNIDLNLQPGNNSISIEGEKICQGKYEENILFGNDIELFPNPINNNTLNVYFGTLKPGPTTVSIYSVIGKSVYFTTTNDSSLKINTSTFSKGLYILNVSNATKNESFKIIQQ